MPENDSTEPRAGLGASLAGKVKEVVGGVLGNESLSTEGRLQQAEVDAAREADTKAAIARAEATEAAQVLSREHAVADARRESARVVTDTRIDQVADEAERARAASQAAVAREAAVAEVGADADVRTARAQADAKAEQEKARALEAERAAVAEAAQEQASAEKAQEAAQRAREGAERLSDEAERPAV